MSLEKMLRSEVKMIEDKLDDHYNQTLLPAFDLNTARWILCLVNEDIARFTLMKAIKIWYKLNARDQRAEIVNRFDHYKYTLKQALDLCAKQLPMTGACGPVPNNEKSYKVAVNLYSMASEYADATRIFSSFHAKSTELFIDRDTGVLQPSQDARTSQYGTLEGLGQFRRQIAATAV
jgi:hypothetical protein